MARSSQETGPTADRPTVGGSGGASSGNTSSNGAQTPPGDERDPASQLAERLLESGARMAGQLLRLARVAADQARERARRARAGLLLGFLLGTTAVVALVSAIVLLARGLSGGLTVWLGTAWLGELAAGLLLLGLVFAGSWTVRHLGDRARLRQLKEKYERDESTKQDRAVSGAGAGADARGPAAGSANDGH